MVNLDASNRQAELGDFTSPAISYFPLRPQHPRVVHSNVDFMRDPVFPADGCCQKRRRKISCHVMLNISWKSYRRARKLLAGFLETVHTLTASNIIHTGVSVHTETCLDGITLVHIGPLRGSPAWTVSARLYFRPSQISCFFESGACSEPVGAGEF